jgi:hypothetical protein
LHQPENSGVVTPERVLDILQKVTEVTIKFIPDPTARQAFAAEIRELGATLAHSNGVNGSDQVPDDQLDARVVELELEIYGQEAHDYLNGVRARQAAALAAKLAQVPVHSTAAKALALEQPHVRHSR